MARGFRGGFNPFRDQTGRYAQAGRAVTKHDRSMSYLERGQNSEWGHAKAGATKTDFTQRDQQFIQNQARAMSDISGPHKGKSIEQIYKQDPAYLRRIAYNGTIFGTHVGNYLRIRGET